MTETGLKKLETCIKLRKMLTLLKTIGKGPMEITPRTDLGPCIAQAYKNTKGDGKDGFGGPIAYNSIANHSDRINKKLVTMMHRAQVRDEMDDFLHLYFSSERGVLALNYLLLSGLVNNRKDDLKHVRNFLRILLDLPAAPDRERFEEPADGDTRRKRKRRFQSEISDGGDE